MYRRGEDRASGLCGVSLASFFFSSLLFALKGPRQILRYHDTRDANEGRDLLYILPIVPIKPLRL